MSNRFDRYGKILTAVFMGASLGILASILMGFYVKMMPIIYVLVGLTLLYLVANVYLNSLGKKTEESYNYFYSNGTYPNSIVRKDLTTGLTKSEKYIINKLLSGMKVIADSSDDKEVIKLTQTQYMRGFSSIVIEVQEHKNKEEFKTFFEEFSQNEDLIRFINTVTNQFILMDCLKSFVSSGTATKLNLEKLDGVMKALRSRNEEDFSR